MEFNLEEVEKSARELSKGSHKSRSETMLMVSLYLPRAWINWLDKMVKQGRYPNRSEAIRYFINYYLEIFQIHVESK